MRIAVIGAGSWGTAVADMVGRKQPVTLWARRDELAGAINSTRSNPDYLPDHQLSEGVAATSDLAETLAGAEAVMYGVVLLGILAGIISAMSPHLSPFHGTSGQVARTTPRPPKAMMNSAVTKFTT